MSTFDRQAILDCLSRLVTPGIKLTALADDLGARKQDYSELRSHLLELVEEGIVQVLPGGAFALSPQGRPADPHAKPVPAVPTEPVKPKPMKAARGRDSSGPTRAPGREARRPKKSGALPWKPAPIKKPSGPREEYDPETGEM